MAPSESIGIGSAGRYPHVVRIRRLHPVPIVLVAALVLGACSAAGQAPTPTTTAITPGTAAPTTTLTPDATVEPSTTLPPPTEPTTTQARSVAWTAARSIGPLEVFDAPEATDPTRVLDEKTILGTPTVVLVSEERGGWLHVLLPGRPNGATGWVRADDVVPFEVTTHVTIDLSERMLRVIDGRATIFETAVGVGSPTSPTPTGFFFVTDAVRITDPSGPWGPFALGLSARSDTVTEFNGGDGIIGIHGTNRPTSIGEAQSLGCVRVANTAIPRIADLVPVGSPVTITS